MGIDPIYSALKRKQKATKTTRSVKVSAGFFQLIMYWYRPHPYFKSSISALTRDIWTWKFIMFKSGSGRGGHSKGSFPYSKSTCSSRLARTSSQPLIAPTRRERFGQFNSTSNAAITMKRTYLHPECLFPHSFLFFDYFGLSRNLNRIHSSHPCEAPISEDASLSIAKGP